MAGYDSGRFSCAALAMVLATLCGAHLAHAQYTFVQDSDQAGSWDNSANWLDGGSNTTYPNAIGATALINQPIWSGVTGGYIGGCVETLDAVLDVVPHALELLAGERPH